MSGEGALHSSGPVPLVRGTAPAFVTAAMTLDDATERLEEAARWLEEKRRDKVKADHELEVAIRGHARALDELRRAI